jgi:hypothetical protein
MSGVLSTCSRLARDVVVDVLLTTRFNSSHTLCFGETRKDVLDLML